MIPAVERYAVGGWYRDQATGARFQFMGVTPGQTRPESGTVDVRDAWGTLRTVSRICWEQDDLTRSPEP
jgi:hypothetical protein